MGRQHHRSVVPDAGHFIPDEQPEAVAAALAGFITGRD